ncbi:hypothetical protein MADE_1010345 [Alteromonas mediterranea DE]|uniref:Uncharacterized protein n=2 Tax=Alteromonas mediterranea TaxID=314275 RepID=A0AAC9ADS9_9ALTE|nr:hypothetical protein MADE_1010345 [Alteromonas mediterranea DE]AMJ79418.1 hypothetical protein AV942_14510 [Alteromonas mediterranea]AMJ83567.1 hypothetical protein AV941_14550 [Alteromonas mediterranea]
MTVTTKTGRYGSKAVRLLIHEPLIPSNNRTNGPTQQMPAPIAAIIPPTIGILESSLIIFNLDIA